MMNLKVSICCITFNHAPYIRECLEGFLMQKCDFDFEILIHDDASTDGTQEIIKEYQEKYPEIIKPIFQIENQWSQGIRAVQSKYNFPRAIGKYIALCEGDDYWTDPFKLQRQSNFLTNHPEYSLCAENSKVIDERENLEYKFSTLTTEKDISIPELVSGRKFHTGSILFRKDLLKIPSNSSQFPFGDTLLFIALAKKGKVKYLPNISSVYRRNFGGVSNSTNRYKWAINVEKFNVLLDEYLEGEYTEIHNKNITQNYYSALKWALKNFKMLFFLKSLVKYLQYSIK